MCSVFAASKEGTRRTLPGHQCRFPSRSSPGPALVRVGGRARAATTCTPSRSKRTTLRHSASHSHRQSSVPGPRRASTRTKARRSVMNPRCVKKSVRSADHAACSLHDALANLQANAANHNKRTAIM